jgi:hypothetical protein
LLISFDSNRKGIELTSSDTVWSSTKKTKLEIGETMKKFITLIMFCMTAFVATTASADEVTSSDLRVAQSSDGDPFAMTLDEIKRYVRTKYAAKYVNALTTRPALLSDWKGPQLGGDGPATTTYVVAGDLEGKRLVCSVLYLTGTPSFTECKLYRKQ